MLTILNNNLVARSLRRRVQNLPRSPSTPPVLTRPPLRRALANALPELSVKGPKPCRVALSPLPPPRVRRSRSRIPPIPDCGRAKILQGNVRRGLGLRYCCSCCCRRRSYCFLRRVAGGDASRRGERSGRTPPRHALARCANLTVLTVSGENDTARV